MSPPFKGRHVICPLPFKGRVRVGMGQARCIKATPHPHPSQLEGGGAQPLGGFLQRHYRKINLSRRDMVGVVGIDVEHDIHQHFEHIGVA